MKRRKRRIMAILLAIAMIFTMVDPSIFGGAITVRAEETAEKETGSGWSSDEKTYYIKDASNLEYVVTHYTDADGDGPKLRNARFVVTDNINLGTSASNRINIGTDTCPFKNEFDGQGYTISGLKFDELIATNGGLFGIMDTGAIIKNLIIDNAHIRSNHYGGILAAQARNAIIQNVTIKNSSCKIASMGNVVGLITTGGLYGGALVGYADNTKIYNCESQETDVYVDTTGAIQALGGDGMYMGGLVGWMENGSILEYSRVVGGEVSTEYYVAVGALAANILYAGGLVGHIDGSDTGMTQILDCFSSAKVSYDGDCYVSVGAGLTGYAGGIAARVSGTNYKMERCHFAGNLSGSLLNSILVLPVVAMEDYYLGGVAGQVENSSNIHNCYFNWDKAIVNNDRKKVPAIYGESNRGDVTTIGEAQYSNPTFFVTFDFKGTDEKTTGNAAPFDVPHANKWVINPANNMPVHGSAVQAEIDFPGAGTISFAATSIQGEQKTNGLSDGSSGLANGTTITQIAQTHAEMNEELTLTATVEPGYNFEGWYLKDSETSDLISTESVLKLGGTEENSYQYEDGDVFVAKYTANVTFFKELNETESGYNGYSNPDVVECTYEQVLDPNEISTSKEGCIFLGWTETDLTNEESIASGIDKKQLTSDKIDATGLIEDPISITRPVTLYPVFIEFGNYNIKVQMQSAALEDGSSYIKGKEGSEGNAIASVDANGNLFISIDEKKGQDGKPVITLDNGYRFDGWYEVSETNPGGTLVSRSKTYYPSDVNTEHRYEARYQYRVTTYIPARSRANYLSYNKESSKFGEFYVGYGVNINDNGIIVEPGFYSKEISFEYWTDDISGIEMSLAHKNEFHWDEMYDEAEKSIPEICIKEPTLVYAIIDWNAGEWDSYHPVIAKTDFPEGTVSAVIVEASEDDVLPIDSGSITMELEIKEGYNLEDLRKYASRDNGESWDANTTVASDDEKKLTDGKLSWKTHPGISTYHNTVIVARLTADINISYLNDNNEPVDDIVKRKYNSLLFNPVDSEGNIIKTENWDEMDEHLNDPIYDDPEKIPVGVGDTPSDKSMYKDGYKFLGWIEKNEKSEADLALYTDPSNPFATTNLSAVEGYLLPKDFRITRTMDICPVYAKYDFFVGTNFDKSSVEVKPTVERVFTRDEEGDGILKLTPKQGDGYTFKDWSIVVDGQTVSLPDTKLKLEIEDNGNGTYILKKIQPIKNYEIIAVYEATVSFKNVVKDSEGNLGSKDEQYLYKQPISDNIDKLPIPCANVNEHLSPGEFDKINMQDGEFSEDTYVFVGWKDYPYSNSETEIIKEPSLSSDYPFVSESDPVIGAMNMIPVYTKPQVGLNSNIGTESKATISVSEEGSVTLEAPEQDGYVFTGWVEKIDGKEESISTESSYVVPPEDLREEHTYTACYDVVITYKIPVVNEDGTIEEGYNGITDIVSYGQALNGNYSIQAINAAKEAFDKTTDKAFTGKWSMEENGTSAYIGTEGITKPFCLYPISTEAVKITYKIPKANENGELIVDENGKPTDYDNFTTNIPVGLALKDGYDDEAKLRVETRMSEGKYMFSGDWTTKEGSEEVYDRATAITENITLYPILKEAVTITYKIPAADDNTGKAVIDNDGKSTNGYDDFKVRIPKGETISDTYDKEASLEVAEVLEDTGWVFTGDWTATEGSEEVYKDATNENKTLYPILKHGKYIPVYFNMSDTVYSIGMVNDEVNEGFIFPKETVLLTTTNASTRGATSIDGRVVSAQFVGYSLVTIDSNGNRTSEKLYKAGETLSQTNLDSYDDDTHRIYAVWTQIQNISGASIYQNKNGSQDGLFTAAAVNTKILANAGLQNSEGASYDRHILYSKDSKYLIVNTDKVTWNNTLYKQYFDKDFVPDENWSIYTSYLYNISSSLDQYGVCPYLSFNYKNDNGANGVGNFRDEDNQTVEYTLEGVAKELLSLNEEVQKSYSWYNYIDLIKDYARGGETN